MEDKNRSAAWNLPARYLHVRQTKIEALADLRPRAHQCSIDQPSGARGCWNWVQLGFQVIAGNVDRLRGEMAISWLRRREANRLRHATNLLCF